MQISYDVSDWKQQYDNGSERPADLDEAIDLMRESSVKQGALAVALIIGRELGKVNDPNLPSNKMANLMGASLALARYRSRQKVKATVQPSGKEVNLRRFVAQATIEDGEQAEYGFDTPNAVNDVQSISSVTVVDYNNPESADRAIAYLMTNVVGRIRDRLNLIALHRPSEVKVVAEELKQRIDEIVDGLA